MASVKNDWIGYLDRSYQQIKASLLARLVIANPEMTDHSESNPLIIFIGMFAGIAEMLGFYIDNMGQESFMATAQRTSSMIKHSRPIDYRIKARNSESVDIVITWSIPVPSQFTIPAGATIESLSGQTFVTTQDYVIPAAVTASTLNFRELTTVTNLNFFTTNGERNQKISLGSNYVQGSLELTVGGLDYTEVITFANSGPTNNNYIIDIFEDGNAYIVLGDGINGTLPVASLTGAVVYRTTLGPDGRIAAGQFDDTTLLLGVVLPGALAVNNANSSVNSAGGSLYEDIEEIRRNAPLSLRTLERMVSRQDHKDIMEMVPGVAKAAVSFICGKNISLYIAPSGGGIASSGLISDAQLVADDKKMGGTFPIVRPAGETQLVIGATVTAKKRKSLADTSVQVKAALVAFGSIDNQEINGSIRLSDVIAVIDNLSNVEFVDLTRMYTRPYARPITHSNALNWENITTSASIAKVKWRLEYDGSNIRVFKNNVFQSSISIDTEFDDTASSGFKFTVHAGAYASGNTWEFTSYPYLQNLTLDDFTLFKIVEADLDINVVALPSTIDE